MEQQHIKHANSNGRVSEVEDGTEENEMSVRTEKEVGKPSGIFLGHIDDGKIEHIDYTTMQPACVAAAVWK